MTNVVQDVATVSQRHKLVVSSGAVAIIVEWPVGKFESAAEVTIEKSGVPKERVRTTLKKFLVIVRELSDALGNVKEDVAEDD